MRLALLQSVAPAEEPAPLGAALARQGVKAILVPTASMMPFVDVPRVTVPAMAGEHPALPLADLPPHDPARLSTQARDDRSV